MSERGLASRREADRLIEEGCVLVDGEVVSTLGVKFPRTVEITLTSKGERTQSQRVTIMLNKPVGIVSAQAEEGYTPAIRLINTQSRSSLDRSSSRLQKAHLQGLAPAGRLDIDSQGLLILTQDGRVAKHIIGESSQVDKEYLVRVNQVASKEQLRQLRFGLSLDGQALKRARVDQINNEQLKFCLTEGKKRQIRRMCELVGLHVVGLKRVRIGSLKLGRLAEGEWRFVDANELLGRS